MSSSRKTSAGLLMFRGRGETLEVLLVHPGGPFWRRKDAGAWTIPKGEAAEGEDLLERARVEFQEELGVPAAGEFIALGSIRQRGGKVVHAWAFEGDLPNDFVLRSNTFSCEWPRRSGETADFPEVDRAEFFDLPNARRKVNAAQITLLDRLLQWTSEKSCGVPNSRVPK